MLGLGVVELFWADTLRWITIAHGSVLSILITSIVVNDIHEIQHGHRPKSALKFDVAYVLSYLLSLIYMTFTVAKQLHHEWLWYVTPIVLSCLILADFALFYRFKHRKENKE
jgi:hypothetical protein